MKQFLYYLPLLLFSLFNFSTQAQVLKIPISNMAGGSDLVFCANPIDQTLTVTFKNITCWTFSEEDACNYLKIENIIFEGGEYTPISATQFTPGVFTMESTPFTGNAVIAPEEEIGIKFGFSGDDWYNIINFHSSLYKPPFGNETLWIKLNVDIQYRVSQSTIPGRNGIIWQAESVTNHQNLNWRYCNGNIPNNYIFSRLDGGDNPTNTVENLNISPNPIMDVTTIHFELKKEGEVSLELYDINGRKIKSFLQEKIEAGEQSHQIDMSDLDVGIYYLHLRTGDQIITEKVVKL